MRKGRQAGTRSPLVKVLAVLLSFAFALSGVPVTAIAEAEAEAEAIAQQELLLDGDEADLDSDEGWVDAEDGDLAVDIDEADAEDDFGLADDGTDEADEAVTVAEFAEQAAERAGEGAGEEALATAAYELMVAAVMPVNDVSDVAAEDVLAGRPADAPSIAAALREVLAELGLEADVLVCEADAALAWTVVKVDGVWLHLDAAQGAREINDSEAEPWLLLSDEELLARDATRSPWQALNGAWEVTEEAEPEADGEIDLADTEAEETEVAPGVSAEDSKPEPEQGGNQLRQINPDDEVDPLSTSMDFVIYENGEMKIGWNLSTTNMYHGWYMECDDTSSAYSVSDGNPWTDSPYNTYVTKVTVVGNVNVSYAYNMFNGMSSVRTMNLSKLKMQNCTSLWNMFKDCSSLTSLNLSSWNTATVRDFDGVFYGCSSLKTLNISSWNTSNLTYHSNTFYGTTSLRKVSMGKNTKDLTLLDNPRRNDGKWYSRSNKLFTPDAISSRGVADTYTWTKNVPTRDISTSSCKASISTQAWTGKKLKPTPTVKWGSTKLTKGEDYKVVGYGTNKNNSTKASKKNWVKIQGIGTYKGTRKIYFAIKKPNVLYYVHRQTYGWEKKYSKKNGQQSGTTGQSKRLEGIYIKLTNKPVTGTIQYRTHIQTYGWEKSWKSAGQMSGTKGKSKRLEAIQIRLTGNMAKKYNVWYRVHAQHFGWMGWTNNGAKAGTAGYSYRLESIQIVLKPKGTSAPAANFMGARRTTSAAFKDRNAKSLKYKFKRDTWSFENFVTYIPKEYYQRMYGTSLGSMMYYDQNYGYAPGVCYGFSTSVGSMIKHGYPKVSSFGASKIFSISKYDRSSTLKMTAESFIQYCYLTQYDYRLLNEMYRNKNNYSGLVSAVRKHQYGGTAIEIDLMGNGGHSVFPIKISANNSSKTVIDIYDNNHPNTLQKLTLYKSGGKYTGFNYSDGSYTWIAWETPASRVKSFMAGNAVYNLDLVVRSDAEGANMNLISTDTDLTVISGGKTYTLSPNNTSDLDMVVPVLTKGGSTKKNLYWVGFDTSDMVVKSLNKDATFSVTTKTGGVEVSAKKGSTLSLSVSDSAKNSVSIDGKKGDAFQVTYREDNGSNDLDEYKVKGTAAGSLVETKLNDSGKVDVKGGTLK